MACSATIGVCMPAQISALPARTSTIAHSTSSGQAVAGGNSNSPSIVSAPSGGAASGALAALSAAKIESEKGDRQIRDGEIKTACEQACPADAIVFGNLNDPDSRVAKLQGEVRNYALLAELNTRPRTTYLAAVRNVNPELGE